MASKKLSNPVLGELRRLAAFANEGAWQAYETDLFSDAKSEMHDVLRYVTHTPGIPDSLRAELLHWAQEGKDDILDRSTHRRGMKASYCMAEICRIIDAYEAAAAAVSQGTESASPRATPKADDAVLGGMAAPPPAAGVLGGLAGLHHSYQSGSLEGQLAALPKAIAYGEPGIDLVLLALESPHPQVQTAAYRLLTSQVPHHPKVQQACQKIFDRIKVLKVELAKWESLTSSGWPIADPAAVVYMEQAIAQIYADCAQFRQELSHLEAIVL